MYKEKIEMEIRDENKMKEEIIMKYKLQKMNMQIWVIWVELRIMQEKVQEEKG